MDEMSELAALYALGALTAADRAAFEAHLQGGCISCQSELHVFQDVTGELGLGTQPVSPPSSLEQRLFDRIDSVPAIGPRAAIILQESGLLISRSANLSWNPTDVLGVWSKPLFVDPVRRYATALIRMEAGTAYPAHRHQEVEELYMLAGDLRVEGHLMGPGDYCRAEALSIHSEITTESGALFLTLSSQKDERLSL